MKQNITNILIIVILQSPLTSLSQTNMNGFKIAIHFQETVFSEVAFNFYKVNSTQWWINKAWGPSIGIENNYEFNKKDFIYAPKIGYDYFFNGCFYQVGLHLIDYINNGTHDFRLSPEIGTSLLVFLNISYSYQIGLQKEKIFDVGDNKLSLKVNFIGMFNKTARALNFNKYSFKRRNES